MFCRQKKETALHSFVNFHIEDMLVLQFGTGCDEFDDEPFPAEQSVFPTLTEDNFFLSVFRLS